VPKESAWFGSYREEEEEGEGGEGKKAIVPMREHPLYVEDWIGLRALDESGRVVLELCEAEHMHLLPECWQPLAERYVGSRS
jgi:palmitoyl-protein thioesterase